MKNRVKKSISLLLAVIMLLCAVPLTDISIRAGAITFSQLNDPSVFLKQAGSTTCTLCATTMMLRRYSMLRGDSNWNTITESSVRSPGWIDGTGLRWSFSYSNSYVSSISVGHGTLPGGSSNASTLIEMLKKCPEGIVIYNTSVPHAVLLTDYTDGVFYCADPLGSYPSGRIPLTSAYKVRINNVTAYWKVTSPVVPGPTTHTHSYYRGVEAAHPHKVYMKCSCGDYYYTGATNTSTNCVQCCENAKYTLTASPSTLTMRVGETKTVTFTESSDGFAVTMNGEYSNDTLSNVSMSDWIDSCKKQVTFTAIKAGTGTINMVLKAYLTGKVVKTLSYKINILPDKYTVSFDANGGSGAPSNQTKTYGQTLTLSSTKPIRSGHTFQSWNTKADGSGTTYLPGTSYTANANVTLYAQWKANTYPVTYNANGGSGVPSNQTKTYGQTLTLSSTKPTRSGYTFQSWNTKADGSGTTYLPGASYTANANVTLYAQWKEVFYGDVDGNKVLDFSDITTINKIIAGKLTATQWQKFIGDVNADGQLNMTDIELINNLRFCNITEFPVEKMSYSLEMVSKPNKTYYKANEKLDFSGLRLKINYTNGVSYTVDSGYTMSATSFSTDGTKNVVVTIGSKSINVAIVIDSVKPTVSVSITNDVSPSQKFSFSLIDSVKLKCYYFGTSSNCYSNPSVWFGAKKTYSETKSISSPGTYYLTAFDASGNVSSTLSYTFYKTVFDTDGGSFTPTSVLTCSSRSFKLPIPQKSGYTFKGWTMNKGSTSLVSSNYKPDSNRTLYAVWSKNATMACNHSYDSGKITTAATCKSTGVKTYTCTVCKATKTETLPKNPSNHVGGTAVKNALTATCTAKGYTGDTYCLGCGVTTLKGKDIAAKGHTDTDNDGKCDSCGTAVGTPAEPENPSQNCSCACHKSGIAKLFFKIKLIFQKIFKKNKVCSCGAIHY